MQQPFKFPEELPHWQETAFHILLDRFKGFELRKDTMVFPVKDKEASFQNIMFVLDNLVVANPHNNSVLSSAVADKLLEAPPNTPLLYEIKDGDEVVDYDWNVPILQMLKLACEITTNRLINWDKEKYFFYPLDKKAYTFFWEIPEQISEGQDFVALSLRGLSPYTLRLRNQFSISMSFLIMFFYGMFVDKNVDAWLEPYDQIAQVITLRQGAWQTKDPVAFKQKIMTQESGDPTPYFIYEFLLIRAFDFRARHLCVMMNAAIECRYYLLQNVWDSCFPETLYIGLVSVSYLKLVVLPWLTQHRPHFWYMGGWRHLVLYTIPAAITPPWEEIKDALVDILKALEITFESVEGPKKYYDGLLEAFPYFIDAWKHDPSGKKHKLMFDADHEIESKRQRTIGSVSTKRVKFEDIPLAADTENLFDEE